MQEFSISKAYGIILKLCAVVCLCFTIFGLVMPFLPPIGHSAPNQIADASFTNAAVSIAITFIFGLAALLIWREGRRMSHATFVTDEDGIWLKDVGKAQGLVPWSAIASMKERSLFQRLDLFDSTNRRLLIIDYQINDFSMLEQLIYDKTYKSTPLLSRQKFTQGVFYHIAWMLFIVTISVSLFVFLHHFYPQLEYIVTGPQAALWLWLYVKQPFGIDIDPQRITLIYPIGKKVTPISDISKVETRDLLKNSAATGNRLPGIVLTLESASKPIMLYNIGAPNNVLYSALRSALEKKSL